MAHFFLGGLFPRPGPDGFPGFLLGQLGSFGVGVLGFEGFLVAFCSIGWWIAVETVC